MLSDGYLLVAVKVACSIFVNQLNVTNHKLSKTWFQFQFELSLAQLSPACFYPIYFPTQNTFGSNLFQIPFWTKNLFEPKTFLTQKFLEPRNLWTKNIFGHNFFLTLTYLYQNRFSSKILVTISFWTKIFFYPKFFRTKHFLDTKYFDPIYFGQNIFLHFNSFWTQYFSPKISVL